MVALRGGAFMSSAPMTPRRPWSGTKNVKKTWELARNLLGEVVVSGCSARTYANGEARPVTPWERTTYNIIKNNF